ncbi:MAG: hypothetical protein BMS9Abin36_0243 [Gammaproteobacteria bacterium]|nr:MAG: hypothetical protein BMS9Abin36_0243 [Gammaproteobacteria bacterium]
MRGQTKQKSGGRKTGWLKPLGFAVALHVVIILLLVIGFHWSSDSRDTGPRVIKVKVVDKIPPKKASKPKPKSKMKKKQVDKKRLAAEKKRKRELKRKKEEVEARRKVEQRALQEQLAEEEKEHQQAERQARADALADEYRVLIRQKVSRNWVRPSGVAKGLKCVVRVRLAATGEVLGAKVITSSGNPLFDRSVENAVYKASPLPIPQEADLFDYFREIEFLFNPED